MSAFRLIIYLTIKFLCFFIEEFILLVVVICPCISSYSLVFCLEFDFYVVFQFFNILI
jgi:hypothetical protein